MSPFLEVAGTPLSLPLQCPGLGVIHASCQGVLILEGDLIGSHQGPRTGRYLGFPCMHDI